MKILIPVLLCVLLVAAGGAVAKMVPVAGEVKHTVVMQHEPKLDLEFMDEIHPYAYATSTPEPYYEKDMNAYADPDRFDAFLALQTHVKSTANRAQMLQQMATRARSRSHRGFFRRIIGGVRRFLSGNDGTKGTGSKPNFNIGATPDLGPMHKSEWETDQQEPTGSFPGEGNWRRAVYGDRRRRMPNEGLDVSESMNPFRRPNNFRTPNDMFRPRQFMQEAADPGATPQDYAQRFAGMVGGNYYPTSSFGPVSGRVGHTGSLGLNGPGAMPVGMSATQMPYLYPGQSMSSAGAAAEVGRVNPVLTESFAMTSLSHGLAQSYPGAFGPAAGAAFGPMFMGRTRGTAYDWLHQPFNPNLHYDGTPITPASHPHAGGPSPFIPGDGHDFHDFYAALDPEFHRSGDHHVFAMGGAGGAMGAAPMGGMGGEPSFLAVSEQTRLVKPEVVKRGELPSDLLRKAQAQDSGESDDDDKTQFIELSALRTNAHEAAANEDAEQQQLSGAPGNPVTSLNPYAAEPGSAYSYYDERRRRSTPEFTKVLGDKPFEAPSKKVLSLQ